MDGSFLWQVLTAAATAFTTGAAGGFATAKYVSSVHVLTARERTAIAEQKATNLSEEVATLKTTLANRDAAILDLRTALAGCQADLKTAMPSDRVQLLEDLQRRVVRYDELRSALLGSEEELWRLRGSDPDDALASALRQSRVKVMTVANLKGGVGKTTITINLAAHFAVAARMRVLVIDLDYQGSLTATALNAAKTRLGTNILADALLGGEIDGRWLADVPRDLASILPETRLVTCGQTFDRFENQTMMRWLIGDITDDVRLRLARLVVSPQVQNAYDIILIDAPPRTSLGAINALCSSHALLVPTVPDSLSVDAVGRFLVRMNKLRGLAPALSAVCVVPSLTQEARLKTDEMEALTEVRTHLSQWSGAGHVTDAFVRHFPTLARTAGRDIGYLSDSRWVRPAFDALGTELSKRLGL